MSGVEAAVGLLHRGVDTVLRLVEFPLPVVTACTGHALGAGAVVLLASDVRIGAEGNFKIGYPELAVGLPLNPLSIALARERLSPRYFSQVCNIAQLYSPQQAIEVGFLDRLVEPRLLVDTAVSVAAHLAGRLDSEAFRTTREMTSVWVNDTLIQTAGDLDRMGKTIREGRPRRITGRTAR